MVDYYKHTVMNNLGGRVVIYAVGEPMDVANEISKHFSAGIDDNGKRLPSPADVFIKQYNEDRKRTRLNPDSKMMLVGAVTYNLGGMYVIYSDRRVSCGLLVHEIFHVVWALARSCGISDDEFNAHIGQYLFELFTEEDVSCGKETRTDGLEQPELF